MKLTWEETIECVATDDYYDLDDSGWNYNKAIYDETGDVSALVRMKNGFQVDVEGMYARLIWKHCRYWNTRL